MFGRRLFEGRPLKKSMGRAKAKSNTSLNVSLFGALAGLGLALLAPVTAKAAELALLLTMPSIFDELILIVSIAALLGAIKVYSSVKGGLLAKSWQFFVIGLICLVVAQIFQLSNTAGYFQAPELLRPVILTAMSGLFLLGVMKARRALS